MPAPSVHSDIHSESVTPNVVVTWFVGYVTKELAEQRYLEFRGLLSACSDPIWIMELTEMTGFDPRAISAGGEWWKYFKSKHQRRSEILLISTHAAARMAGASLGFSIGVGVRSFRSLDECFNNLGIVIPLHRHTAG